MRPADIKTIRERSDFGRRARRPFIFWLAAVGALALAASAVHILFFADILRIQTVSISENGRISESSDGKAILAAINSVLEEKKIPLADRANMVYMGTSVASGKARTLVAETGCGQSLAGSPA